MQGGGIFILASFTRLFDCMKMMADKVKIKISLLQAMETHRVARG
jgi:hypothetical protein